MKAKLICMCLIAYFVQHSLAVTYPNNTKSYVDADFIKQGPVNLFWSQLKERLPAENGISRMCKNSLEALVKGIDEGKTWPYQSNFFSLFTRSLRF